MKYFSSRRNKPQKKCDLRNIIVQNKVKVLTKNFIKKIRRNSVYRTINNSFDSFEESPNGIEYNWKSMLS